jgi:hypothetical protein
MNGKYIVGLKKFVERQMVEKFLSKNFRRHSTSSIESEGVGVGWECGIKVWVWVRAWSESVGVGEDVGCGCESVVYPSRTLRSTRTPTPSLQTLNHTHTFIPHSHSTPSLHILTPHPHPLILSMKWSVDEMLCRRNVLSTKCLSTKVSLDERHRIRMNGVV